MYLKIYFLIIKITLFLQRLGLFRLSIYPAKLADKMNRRR